MAGLFSDFDFNTEDYSKNKITLDEEEILNRLNPYGLTMDSSDNIRLMEKLYFKKGIRRIEHFVKPRVLDYNNWYWPWDTEVHVHKVSKVLEPFTKDYCFFKNNPRTIVDTVVEYTEDATYGKYKYKTTPTLAQLVVDASKQEREFTFLKPKQTIRFNNRVVYVVNYNFLNVRYIYPEQIMLRYNLYRNTTITILNNMFKIPNRNNFLVLEMPSSLPSRVELNKYSTRLINAYLENLPTVPYFNLLELYRLLSPDTYKESVFSIIPKEKLLKINLLIHIDTKLVLLNMGFLLANVKEYGLQDIYKTKPRNSEQFKLLFYKFIETIINTPVMSDTQLESLEKEIDTKIVVNIGDGTSGTKQEVSNSINIDVIIEKEQIIEKHNLEEKEIEEDNIKKLNIPEEEQDIDLEDETEEINVEDILVTSHSNIDEIKNDKPKYNKVSDNIEALRDYKVISKQQYNRLNEIKNKQSKSKDPYGMGIKIEDVLDAKEEESILESNITNITDNKVILDKSYNKDITKSKEQSYLKNQYKKDILRTVYSIQNSKYLVEDYNITKKESILGSTEEHVVKINSLSGNASSIKFVLPTIKEDGTFTINNQTYTLRSQKTDAPIRKLTNTRVALTSNYGKLFIDKAAYKKEDAGYYIANKIATMYRDGLGVTNLNLVSSKLYDVKLPKDYALISRYVKFFNYDKYVFNFDYPNRYKLYPNLDKTTLEKLESDNLILIGKQDKHPILMDSRSRLFVYNKGFTEIPGILELLNIDRIKEPIEYVSIKLYKKQIPIVVILGYYYGLEPLLDIINAKYTIHTEAKRIPRTENNMVIKFKDSILEIERDNGIVDLIFGGLLQILNVLKLIPLYILNNKSNYTVLFNRLDYSILYTNEISLLEEMYVDPVTLSILEILKQPTNFKGLLIKAVEMLQDDNYKNPNGADGICIKGYDRVAGMLYKELITSIKEKENKSIFSKTKISINPYAVMSKLQDDSTTALIDDLNPMASLKQKEDVTALGAGGRSKEGMSKDTRSIDVSEIGILSEAAKDNGDVGISGYLSAVPNIKNTRGIVDAESKEDNLEWGNLLSSSALLGAFATTDDAKRLNFSSIMNSHVIPINEMRVPYVRTGYEAIIPIRSSDKFAITAKHNGIVVKVTNKELTVRYDNEEKDTKYKISNWTTKEESEACYTHVMVSNVVQGEKFNKDDTLVYDSSFFEPDIFNPKRVIYKQGSMITVAMLEDLNTHEDSSTISKETAERFGTVVTKVLSKKIDGTANIFNYMLPGRDVNPDDVLFSIVDGVLPDNINNETLELLKNLTTKSPKAKVKGYISKVEVRYNIKKEEMSKSVRELVDILDKYMVDMYGYTGEIDGSYTIKGVLLQPGEIELKYYITVGNSMGIGDKWILGNQAKCTIGEVFFNDITAEDGTKIDATFSARSISNRIINSPWLIGTTSMLLEKVKDKAVSMYFNT